MAFTDDDLTQLAAHGTPPLPPVDIGGFVENAGARIWYGSVGTGAPVVLLHGGLGNSGNFAHQVPALVAAGYRVILVDSRGQGRSSRDARPYSYQLMASDVVAVMDRLAIARAAIVGWSDGAATGLVMARETPERVTGLFFFACNVDATGTLPFQPTPIIDRIYAHHQREYAALSPLPGGFEQMRDDLGVVQADQPGYTAADLAGINAPVWVVLGERDEFIRREHAEWIAASLPNGRFLLLPEVSHFAPLQRPDDFRTAVLDMLVGVRSESGHHGD